MARKLRMEPAAAAFGRNVAGKRLAATARQQLLKFYAEIDCLKNWEIWDWVKSDWESCGKRLKVPYSEF